MFTPASFEDSPLIFYRELSGMVIGEIYTKVYPDV